MKIEATYFGKIPTHIDLVDGIEKNTKSKILNKTDVNNRLGTEADVDGTVRLGYDYIHQVTPRIRRNGTSPDEIIFTFSGNNDTTFDINFKISEWQQFAIALEAKLDNE